MLVVAWLQQHLEITPYLVGQEFVAVAGDLTVFDDVQSLIDHLGELPLPPHSVILLKGSRGVTLEKVLPTLRGLVSKR